MKINQSKNTEREYFVHKSAYIDAPCQIGKGTKIWHFSHVMANSIIGDNCNIGQNVVISPHVILGNQVKVQNNVSIYTGVICEDDVFLGPSCVFTNVINPRAFINRQDEYRKTVVKKGATIGANATIVCGHNIGKYAMVGAGAIVTKDVPDYALVVGGPTKIMDYVCVCGQRLNVKIIGQIGKRLLENNYAETYICNDCSRAYEYDGQIMKSKE